MVKFKYGEYIFQQLITSDFVQSKLTQILVSIVANLINSFLTSILCALMSFHRHIDIPLHIIITVFMTLRIGWIYNYLEEYEPVFHAATQYLINNYTAANYRYWKKIVILLMCAVGSGLLLIVNITNWMIFFYIVQYLACFLIVEQFEERSIQKFIKEYLQRPTTKRHTQDTSTDLLIESYTQPKKKVLKGRVSKRDQPIVRIPQHQESSPCKPIVRIPLHNTDTDTDKPIVRIHRQLSESTPNVQNRFESNDLCKSVPNF